MSPGRHALPYKDNPPIAGYRHTDLKYIETEKAEKR